MKRERERSLRKAVCVIATVLSVGLAGTAMAAPMEGNYVSEGGSVLEGRWSEGYADGNPGQTGNTVNAWSWDDPNAGTQWTISGPAVGTAGASYDANTGQYVTEYDTTNAFLTLKDGPWTASGDGDYTVDVTYYRHDTTVQQDGSIDTVVTLWGDVVGYANYTVDLVIAIASRPSDWEGVHPGGSEFPPYLPQGADTGHWGNVQGIDITITPEPAAMSVLGFGALAMLLKRRRRRA